MNWKDHLATLIAMVIATLIAFALWFLVIEPQLFDKPDIEFISVKPKQVWEGFDTTFNITIENTGKKTASDVYLHVKTKGFELKNSALPHDGFFSPKDDILQYSEQANVIFDISATEYNPYQEYSIEIYSNCHRGSYKKIFDGTFIYSEDYNYWYLIY